jgi:hypothetical protein
MDKSPQILDLLNVMAEAMGGKSRTDSLRDGTCVACSEEVNDFRDDLSVKEYGISGLCQPCQDEVFGING